MKRRPFCVMLAAIVLIILCFVREGKDPVTYDGEEKTLIGQVEQIRDGGGKTVLVLRDVAEQGVLFGGKIQVYEGEESENRQVKIGNIVSVTGNIYSFEKPGNPGQFDEYKYYHQAGIQARVFSKSLTIQDPSYDAVGQWLYEARKQFYNAITQCLPEEQAGVAAAILLGEKSGLTSEIKDLYQENGISHILAISGLHISLVGAGLFYFLRRFVMPMKGAVIVSVAILFLYGEMTGFPVSAQRAVCMTSCLLFARFLGRRYDRLSALALSACILLLGRPELLYQSGFLLSYGTVLGIEIFLPLWKGEPLSVHKNEPTAHFQEHPVLGKGQAVFKKSQVLRETIGEALLANAGIFLITAPVLLYFYFEINFYTAAVNLFVLPFISAVILLSFGGGMLAFLSVQAGRFVFGTVHYILTYYEGICRVMGSLPFAPWIAGRPSMWQIGVYYGGLCVWAAFLMRPGSRRGKWRLLAPLCLFAVLLFPFGNRGELTITNLDVGQGDCACVRYEGTTILLDGGSTDEDQVGKYRISQYLKYYGVRRVDYLFITHGDADHVNGLMEIVQDADHMGLELGAVVLPELEKADAHCQEIEKICRENGVAVKKMARGGSLRLGNLSLECLHPAPDYDWQTENDYSLVLLLRCGDFQGLFTGDLEETGERALLEAGIGPVDYLKVGHHGSKNASSAEFLEKIRPRVAVISAGKDNRYGHPAAETVERLRRAGSRIFCTIDAGAVTYLAENGSVDTYKSLEK